MVEFALPKNSRITGGKTWPKPAGATETREVKVYRWNPDDGKNPRVGNSFYEMHACAARRYGRPVQGPSAASSACGEGPGAGSHQFLRAICLDRAVAEDHHA